MNKLSELPHPYLFLARYSVPMSTAWSIYNEGSTIRADHKAEETNSREDAYFYQPIVELAACKIVVRFVVGVA